RLLLPRDRRLLHPLSPRRERCPDRPRRPARGLPPVALDSGGRVQCSPASRAPRFRCPRTPSPLAPARGSRVIARALRALGPCERGKAALGKRSGLAPPL